MENIIVKLLDWPFLAFAVLIIFLIAFNKEIRGILSRGDITIAWGKDRNIRLRELSESLDEELGPIRDDLETLKETISKLHAKSEAKELEYIAPEDQDRLKPGNTDAHSRMKDALINGKWRWRGIERLAIIGAVSESEALNILRSDPEIVFGRGKSGNLIARHAAR